jgi:hypothetical protein
MAMNGILFFAALFFNGMGMKPPHCEGDTFAFMGSFSWIGKFVVGLIIGTIKGGLVAVLLLLFKRKAIFRWLPEDKKTEVIKLWKRKEHTFTLIALGYMSFCSFFVAVFLMTATDKLFPKYVRAASTGFTVALFLKPFSNICLHYPVLLFVKTGRANQRRCMPRTFLEVKAAKYLSDNPGYADFNHELRPAELALSKNPLASKLLSALDNDVGAPKEALPEVPDRPEKRSDTGVVDMAEIILVDTDDFNGDLNEFRPKYFYNVKCDLHPAACCHADTFDYVEEVTAAPRPTRPERCGEIVEYEVPHRRYVSERERTSDV